jgi:acyl-CoA synthetase (NDP forming)
MFRQAGVIQVDTLDEMFDVAQLVAHQPLPRGRRVAIVGNSDALGLLAADAAVAVGLEVKEPVALGSDATAEDFEEALDAAIDDPDVDSVVAVFIPPLNTTGVEVANVLAAVGEQSDKPLVSTFLGAEGVPELLRVPDVAGSTAGRGSVPSYPAVEAAVRALARVVTYAEWRRRPEGELVAPDEVDLPLARRIVNQALVEAPEGRDLTFEELRGLLDAYGIDLWERIEVDSEDAAVAAAEKLGYDVVLKATAEHLRQRPDLAHVWRNIDAEDEMRHAWHSMRQVVDEPDAAGFIVQRVAAPGIPVGVAGMEDPLFGPVVMFGISGATTELLGDRAYRIPPMHSGEAADMVREIKAAPLLFGYRGSEKVDVDAVEHLLLRVAQLKNDLPQVRSLDLNLVLVGAAGATVLNAVGRVEPVTDARSDWYARRLSTPAGDTMPG